MLGYIRLEHFSWLQLSHLAAIVCRSAQNSAPTVTQPPCRLHKMRCSTRLRARVQRERSRSGFLYLSAGGSFARASCVALYQLSPPTQQFQTIKASELSGLGVNQGPVAGVRPISGKPAGHRREIVRDDCLWSFEASEDAELSVEVATNEQNL